MIVVMSKNASGEMIRKVLEKIESEGLEGKPVPGRDRMVINVIGDTFRKSHLEMTIGDLAGVREAKFIGSPYKLVSRESKEEDTIIEVGSVKVGNGHLTLIAGPCAIENEQQAVITAWAVKKAGAMIFRGGAFKPRTNPYQFQGLGEEGLKILAKVRELTGMPIVSEAMDHVQYDLVEAYVDIVQIGTRNMQNYSLLKRAGQSSKPVLLKRGISATIDEWLQAAEYIVDAGNHQVILCERGIRTYAHHSRNTLDLSAIPVVQKESHLPIIVDPSHAAGKRDQVAPLARAAAAVGCNGLMIEVHNEPDKALCDGAQSLYPEQFSNLVYQIRGITFAINDGFSVPRSEDEIALGLLHA